MTPAELAKALKEALAPELFTAMTNLDYLFQKGALAGVAEVIAERRRQIEQAGQTLAHDDEHVNGELVPWAGLYLDEVRHSRMHGREDREADTDVLGRAGATVAAEIDRLGRRAEQ